jgi:chitodextrinase
MKVIRNNKVLYSNATGVVAAPVKPVVTPTVTATTTASTATRVPIVQTPVRNIVTPTTDKIAPSGPNSINANALNSSQVNLSWGVATDNIKVVKYNLYRNGTLIKSVLAPTTTFTDSGLSALTNYTYKVVAIDAAGNKSTGSQVSVKTLASVATNPTPTTGGGIGGGSGVVYNEEQNPFEQPQAQQAEEVKSAETPTDVKGTRNEGKEEPKKGLLADFTTPQKGIVVLGFVILAYLGYKKFINKGK